MRKGLFFMGIYLNPGFENFKEQSTQDLFVDKTRMLSKIWRIMDSGNKYICMSRPRRFGKTYAGNMLSCYFSKGCDSGKLFAQRDQIGYEQRVPEHAGQNAGCKSYKS